MCHVTGRSLCSSMQVHAEKWIAQHRQHKIQNFEALVNTSMLSGDLLEVLRASRC